jgi:hypothetical protein
MSAPTEAVKIGGAEKSADGQKTTLPGKAKKTADAAGSTQKQAPTKTAIPDIVEYYRGHTQALSTDRKTKYGPPRTMLLKRILSPSKNEAREVIVRALKRSTRVMTRVPGTHSFSFKARPYDEKGTVTFFGQEWAWTTWRYQIDRFGSGLRKVDAKVEKGLLIIEHEIFGPDGKPTGRALDRLRAVTAQAYVSALRAWEKKRGAPGIGEN